MQNQNEQPKIAPLKPGEKLVEELKAGQRIRVGNTIYKVTTVRPNGKVTIKPMRVVLNAIQGEIR